MAGRKAVVVAGLAVVLAGAVIAAAQEQEEEEVELPEQTVRYIGVRTDAGKDGKQTRLYVEPMKGGQRTEVRLSGTQRMKDYFQELAPGQPITVGLIKSDGKLYLDSINAMPPEPGEKDHDTAYIKGVEVRKINNKAVTVLILTKFDQRTLVEVPKVRTKEGPETSPELLKAIKAVKPGTLVEVEAHAPKRTPGRRRPMLPVLKFITPWTPWRRGVYSKLGKKKIDKTTYIAVQIKSSGIPLVLFVPKVERSGRAGDDRTMLRFLQKLKPGQAVEFKIRQDGLNQFIRKIRPSVAVRWTERPDPD